jgi:hypothetical protein
VSTTPEGVLLRIPGRDRPTGIPADPTMPGDPVSAWTEWLASMRHQGSQRPESPAFPKTSGSRISAKPITEYGLNAIVHDAVERAHLDGRYAFTSLRTGLIRTALRAEERAHVLAAHADLRSLDSVARHERRENLIRHSVAGQLGL